jgi:hypothetical protein
MEVNNQLHAVAALHPEKEPRYPFNKRLGGLQSQSGGFGEKKNLCSYRESKHDSSVDQVVG